MTEGFHILAITSHLNTYRIPALMTRVPGTRLRPSAANIDLFSRFRANEVSFVVAVSRTFVLGNLRKRAERSRHLHALGRRQVARGLRRYDPFRRRAFFHPLFKGAVDTVL